LWALKLPMRPFNGQFGMQGKDSAALSMGLCVFEKKNEEKKRERERERERERALVGNPCLTAAVMLNVGLFFFTDCGWQRHRVTPLLLCKAMNLHICLEEAKRRRLCT